MPKIPVVTILCDHAVHMLHRVVGYDHAALGMSFAALEANSVPFLERAGVPRSRIVCLPWGGPPPDPSPKPFAGRAYDIIFHGSLDSLIPEQEFLRAETAVGLAEPEARAILRAAERVVEGDIDPDRSLPEACAEESIDTSRLDLMRLARMVKATDIRSRAIRRERFLSAFADAPVHFFGNYPEAFKRKFSRAVFHENKSFSEISAISRNAKIALCDMVNFRRNAHLRLMYDQAHGCLSATEHNDRLGGDFTDMENIIFASHPYPDIADKVRAVLADPARGQAMVDAARPIYKSRYTWRETVKALIPLLPPLDVKTPLRLTKSKNTRRSPIRAKLTKRKTGRLKSR
ncbi:MAG: glycosyltransferase family 1 protein [Acidimicrobiia bacterium]|nr:glycosyltransferase family 1 protein [Acidimicrobiia bacterium]